jgi:hypothetical protein
MKDFIKNIIREEFERVMSKKYSEDEVNEAIHKKSFVHTRDGKVYSPVMLKRGFFMGVDSDNEHVDISIDEIALIQSKEERFGNK